MHGRCRSACRGTDDRHHARPSLADQHRGSRRRNPAFRSTDGPRVRISVDPRARTGHSSPARPHGHHRHDQLGHLGAHRRPTAAARDDPAHRCRPSVDGPDPSPMPRRAAGDRYPAGAYHPGRGRSSHATSSGPAGGRLRNRASSTRYPRHATHRHFGAEGIRTVRPLPYLPAYEGLAPTRSRAPTTHTCTDGKRGRAAGI